MVICNFWFCCTDNGNEGGFSDIRITNQSHVSEQFQFEDDLELFAWEARLCETGNLTGGGCEVAIASAAVAAFCENLRFIGREIRHNSAVLGIPDNRSPWNFDHKVGSTFSGASFCTAIFAPLCDIFFVVTEIEQRRQVGIYLKDDIAAFATVSAVWAAGSNIFFPMKRNCTVTAVSSFDINFNLINKHSNLILSVKYGWMGDEKKIPSGKARDF